MLPRRPRSSLFPYTTLFRSRSEPGGKTLFITSGECRAGILLRHRQHRLFWLAHCHAPAASRGGRSEEHTSELQSRPHLVCRLLLEKKKLSFFPGAKICVLGL